jgi:hypothetical protein
VGPIDSRNSDLGLIGHNIFIMYPINFSPVPERFRPPRNLLNA